MACSTDDRYFPMTFVFLISIIKNKYLASKYRIYILLDSKNSRGVDKIKTKYYECFEYLDLMCMKFNVKIYVSNISCVFKKINIQLPKIASERFPISSVIRLYLSYLFSKKDKIIWLDVDTIVEVDLSILWNINLDKQIALAACLHTSLSLLDFNYLNSDFKKLFNYCKTLNLDPKTYINAGVLILSLDKIRKFKLDNKLHSRCTQEINLLKYKDQDIINLVLKDYIMFLDNSFNVSENDVNINNKFLKDFNPKIFHYYGSKLNGVCPKPHNHVWWKYASFAPPHLFNFFHYNAMFLYFKELIGSKN
ncbi:glycosyltransferase family 8 protein [Campylobacter coli]|uniref:glycosyltransferase family 8 protein n=1 Tax=Campylobacter coli TaxID=195 RepID=UPI0022367465